MIPTPGTDETEAPLRSRIIAGTLWIVPVRWGLRFLTVVRTVVLARLLVPSDFGLVAMATLTLQFIGVLSDFGIERALVRLGHASREQFDVGWTLRCLQRLALSAVVYVLAPVAGSYFENAEVVPIVRIVALAAAVSAFENVGPLRFQIDLAFEREAAFAAASDLLTLLATIAAAVVLQNYWALVVAYAADRWITVALSYAMHPFRPRFRLAGWRAFWSFSRWVPVQNVGNFLRGRTDAFLVARYFGATGMGLYGVGVSASGVSAELMGPVSGTLLPGYARRGGDPQRLAIGYTDALGMMALLYFPAAIGMAAIAPTLVPVLLGERWLPAVPLVQALAVYNLVNGLAGLGDDVLVVLGRMRRLTVMVYLQLLVYVPLLVAAASWWGTTNAVAVAKGLGAVVVAPMLLYGLAAVSDVRFRRVGRVLWRPLLASVALLAAVRALQSFGGVGVTMLLAQVAIGGAAYGVALGALWWMAGRPSGSEQTIVAWLGERLRSR